MSAMPETTHTPQGDGNSLPGVSLASMIWETTPTPQGDGNEIITVYNEPIKQKQPTPRKRTEIFLSRYGFVNVP